MKRPLLKIALFAALVLVAGLSVRADDEIRYYDRAEKKEAKIAGKIQDESVNGIKIRAAKETKDRQITSSDIREVSYQVEPGLALDYRKPFGKEDRAVRETRDEDRKKYLTEAVADYRELLPRLGKYEYAQRYVQFRAAQALARLAEDDATQQGPAIDALAKYKKEHPKSWEVIACTKLLGQLYEAKNDLTAAQSVYQELTARTDLPAETRQEARFLAVRVLMTGKKYDDAEKQLEELRKDLPPEDAQAARIQVYLVRCQLAADKKVPAEEQLKKVLAGNADSAVKGMACNTLADFYLRKDRLEDAFWQYLWVDVVFNQDKEEHAEALYHLSKLFDKVKNDPARAQQCQERLLKEKEFAGMKYQKKALKEK